MNILNSIKNLNTLEKRLWLFSILLITVSFIISNNVDIVIMLASLVGVTALIFVAKGDVLGQVLTVVFSLFYAIVSFKLKYYGEMITYLGMTTPIACLSIYTWVKNPYSEQEVAINKLNIKSILFLIGLSLFVTYIFSFILKYFGTSSLLFSTLSVATSFLASSLMMLRSPYYAVAYALNDLVLIVLWVLATAQDIVYFPMVICFIIFFINDSYGFINWKAMERKQSLVGES